MAANKNLFKTRWFWAAVLLPLFAFLALSAVIWIADDQWFAWQPDSEGFNNYLQLYKLPLGVLALIVPAVALVTANHRSKQAAANLIAQQRQNVFSNYYKHIEEFESYVERIKSTGNYDGKMLQNLYARAAHRELFPNAMEGTYTPISELLSSATKADESFSNFLRLINETDFSSFCQAGYVGPNVKIDEECFMLYLADNEPSIVTGMQSAITFITKTSTGHKPALNKNLEHMLQFTKKRAAGLSIALKFDTSEMGEMCSTQFFSIAKCISNIENIANENCYRMGHQLVLPAPQ